VRRWRPPPDAITFALPSQQVVVMLKNWQLFWLEGMHILHLSHCTCYLAAGSRLQWLSVHLHLTWLVTLFRGLESRVHTVHALVFGSWCMQHACLQGSIAQAPSSTYVRVDSGVREGDEVSDRHGFLHTR
jgi:hypothetical protein